VPVDVRLVDVVKRYGDAIAVDHIDLEVQTGEFFSLLGPSGCGKTTTLRMIGGFEEPTSGLIELKGEDVTWLPPYKRHVNTVFQNYALFPHLSIFENVAFGLRRQGVGEADVRQRVGEMLQLVELPGFERRKPTQISGGQAQRVALARALINRPSVLLLDEPLGALDLKLRKQMQVELKRIQQEVGITFIFVTHDQEEAMTMSDRIAVMNKGRYEQLADPASLYERPRTRFVAGFLGVSNLLTTTPTGTSDGYAVSQLADGTTIRVPAALTEGLERYEVGVRPEKIRLRELADEVPADLNRLEGVITDASYLGVSTQYQVQARGGATITVYEQNVERATRAELWKPGEEVRMTWSPDHTFAVEAGGTPPPDVVTAATVAGEASPAPVSTGPSRRAVLVGGALVAVGGVAAFLAATSGGSPAGPPVASGQPSQGTGPTPDPSAGGSAAPPQVATGPLNFANWDAYIDLTTVPGPDGQLDTEDDEYDLPSPTLDEFAAQYGVEVNYANAEIDGNESFMATITPQLEAGVPTGWDLIVLTDFMAAKVIEAGWAEPLDPAVTATAAANVRDELRGMPWDPEFTYHYPWQSGATGVGYNSESTGRELTKLEDLFDPAFAGKVTLLDDVHDTFPLIHTMLQARGEASATPSESMTVEDAQVVHDFLKPYVDNGHIRAFRGNAYLQDFGSGDTWVAMVWSGDLASSAGPNDVFVYPEEGSNLFTDNMLIPKGAVNKYTAELMIDWVYDVDRAARIANFVYYISPVKGVAEAIKAIDEEAATNPLLFPPPDVLAKQHPQPQWDDATESAVAGLYADLAGV
jgi:spermidine/putrescine transport system ATP-binding protein